MAVKYDVKFLIEKCELHLLAAKAMRKDEKVLLASELGRTKTVVRFTYLNVFPCNRQLRTRSKLVRP